MINKKKWFQISQKKPKVGKKILLTKIEEVSVGRKSVFDPDSFWTPVPSVSECEHFYLEYPEIANIIECILGFPVDGTDQAKGKYYEVIREAMSRAVNKLKTE